MSRLPAHRYAYFKSGNVVHGLRTFGNKPAEVPAGGPVAFYADFLNMAYPHQVLLVSFGNADEQANEENVNAWCFKHRAVFLHPFASIFQEWLAVLKTWACLRRFRPNRFLCGRIGVPLWLAVFYCRLLHVPFVHSLHSSVNGSGPWHFRFRRVLDRYCLRKADAVICHGPFLERQLLEIGIQKEKVIAFDTGFKELVEQSAENQRLPSEITEAISGFFLLYVGRIVIDKGVFDLLEAALPLLAKEPHLSLVYVGDGPDRAALEKRSAAAVPPKRIHFFGHVPHLKLGGLIRRAKVVVTPTRRGCPEGRCMTAMEGLSLGVPVVAPNHGPFPFLITDRENGLLYSPDSSEDLSKKLAEIFFDQALYEKLILGVRKTQKKFFEPDVKFSEAVGKAFVLAEKERS